MKVSIITVCYNSEKTIEHTIQSVLSQDYPDIEYLLIDGQSKDQTIDIANKYKKHIAKIVSQKDKGIYDAINKGIQLASGDIVGILNADDFYIDKKVISKIVHLFQTKRTDSVYADLVYVKKDDTDKIVRYWKSRPYRAGLFLRGWMPPHPTFFVKKTVYDKYGLYTTQLSSAADYEFMLRVLHRHKISTAYLPEVIIKMRVGGKSNINLKNRLKANLEDRKAWKMNHLKPNILTLTIKPLLKIYQYF